MVGGAVPKIYNTTTPDKQIYDRDGLKSPEPNTGPQDNDNSVSLKGFPSEQSFKDFKFDETISATFQGRKETTPRKATLYILSVLSLGTVYLLTRWFPRLKTRLLSIRCPLIEATHILVTNSFGQTELVKVNKKKFLSDENGKFSQFIISASTPQTITLNYRCNSFLLDPRSGLFIPMETLIFPCCLPEAEYNMEGLTEEIYVEIKHFMGNNEINIEEKSGFQIFVNEILHPFFVFQVASFIIWILENYYLYAFVILAMATFSAILTVLETKENLDKMRKMARFVCPVKVSRGGQIVEISSEDLVPGDLVILDHNLKIVPCDGVLLNGDAIVDESMLTGESVPITKIDMSDEYYVKMLETQEEDPRFTLYCGTTLLRCRSRHGKPAMLLATRTGFHTTKGSLVQSILFPRPNKFRFYRDSMLYIAVLGVIAFFGFSIAVVNSILIGVGLYFIIFRALDVITVVVPPALPATMAVGTVFAIKRLESKQIFCISPPRINVASKVSVFCFDKTGTLTEEGLEIFGILPVVGNTQFSQEGLVATSEALLQRKDCVDLLKLMATCHSLRRINGRLLGDSLDLRMFEFSKWEIEELLDVGEAIVPTVVRPPGSLPFNIESLLMNHSPSCSEMGIVRQFDFCSKLRRASVIVRPLEEETHFIYCKGSPESLLQICLSQSIPSDYSKLLAYYAHNGYRVIGCAAKVCPNLTWLKAQKMSREQAEKDLIFLGFIIFENRLKLETEPTITILKEAFIKNIMVTGDNILTAISVGRASGIVKEDALIFYPESFVEATSSRNILWQCVDDINRQFDSVKLVPSDHLVDSQSYEYSLAMTGDFFEWIQENITLEYRKRVLAKCFIFARMSPQQKQLLVELLQADGTVVGFCGDGANDCGALKAADVGVSLSQAEASIAAPFTSRIQNISCVPTLLLEGRASLVTSFCSFKYMTLYSMIQFTTLIFLYSFGSSLSDGQFVFVDLLLIVPLGIFMTRNDPAKILVPKQPTAKLISPTVLSCILGHIFLQALFQLAVYKFYAVPAASKWIKPGADETNTLHPTTTVLFLFSIFLYIGTAVIFSAGKPFRSRFYWPFIFYAMLATLASVLILFLRIGWVDNWLYLTQIPLYVRFSILALAFAYILLAYIYDRFAVPIIASRFELFM